MRDSSVNQPGAMQQMVIADVWRCELKINLPEFNIPPVSSFL